MAQTRFAAIPTAGLFTPDHDELRRVVRTFVERDIRPRVEEWERARDAPYRELFRMAGTIGLFGAKVEPRFGGTGPDLVADAVITEELARCGSGGVAAALGAHKDLALHHLSRLGSEEQKRRWLAGAVSGETIGALAVAERGGRDHVARSGMRTRAHREGDGWRLTGAKAFVTNGPIADILVVAARTDPGSDDGPEAPGVGLFVVESGAPGLVARRIETVGWRTAHIGELTLEGTPANLLGDPIGGWPHLEEGWRWQRLTMALEAVAAAEQSLQIGLAYGRERRAFGRPVASFQVWRHRFADLATEIEAARSLAYLALREMVAGEDATRAVCMAKWFATELGWRVADESLQIHGGYGYMMEFPVQRAWRDSRLGPVGGGSTEAMKEIIASSYGL